MIKQRKVWQKVKSAPEVWENMKGVVSVPDIIDKKLGKSSINWLPLTSYKTQEEVYESWCTTNFLFKQADSKRNIDGLRPPQIGGIYAALGFEKSDEITAGTIVMPTGTGKTETILSIIVAGKFRRTLLIVPSDALREQTKNKLTQLGLLRQLGLLDALVENPFVATIKQAVKSYDELQQLLESNVIVATPSALTNFSDECLNLLANACSHLIIDEAHHVTAMTWAKIKSRFVGKPIFQFTATPFRTDGSRVEGKILFNYPLKKAQIDGYFKPIEFHPVREFVEEDADRVIADKAVELLRKDLLAGFDHIAMARAKSINRAKEIFKLYEGYSDLNPVLINSETKKKAAVLSSIRNGEHKVIVCVDMLGEGFDLPQLKISAIHDPHKSINVMLQYTGRFTRTTSNVGDAKFVANVANPQVNVSLEELYKEDSDWNSVISDISFEKIKDEKEYQNFRAEFTKPSKLLDLGLTPTISTTVYKMTLAKWKPDNFKRFGQRHLQIIDFTINDQNDLLVFSVKSHSPVLWTGSKELFDESWDLYIAYFDRDKDLLFVHSSAKDGLLSRLVKLIAENALLIKGEKVFRAMAGLKRLKLQNVGLNKKKKGLRYSMHTGTEINDQIPDIEAKRAIKSNIFGKGYENGRLVSIGCSYKGKIWAMDSDSLDKWIKWCKAVGNKLLDDSINTNAIMKTAMKAEELSSFPQQSTLYVEWPVELLRKNESKITISSATWIQDLLNCELRPAKYQDTDHQVYSFELVAGDAIIKFSGKIIEKGEIKFESSEQLTISVGANAYELNEFFDENPPLIFLSDTSTIDGGLRYFTDETYAYIYDKDNLEVWDWAGVDISVESQTELKIANSVQYHTIQQILKKYDVVFDDDGSGEVADIVAIKNLDNETLIVDLYHCKYCPSSNGVAKAGARVDDVYQVAGQAIKSVKWLGNAEGLINRLMDREEKRLKKSLATRIDKGTYADLVQLSKLARYATLKFGISIVQPAISCKVISPEIQTILGATEAYIHEVSGVKLRVIING